MKRRILAMLLAVVLTLGIAAVPAAAAGPAEVTAVTYMNSGRTSVPKMNLGQLRALYQAITPCPTTIYANAPVIAGSNYRPATLSPEAMNHAQELINYYRKTAGLGNITLSETANMSSGWGALLLAMNGKLTHYPSQPKGMSNVDYEMGYYATTHSNIFSSTGFPANRVLDVSISGQVGDSDVNNAASLGHRRWILNPNASTMGIGLANVDQKYYTDVSVFGSYVLTASVSDYCFISWPASGFNLSDTFPVDSAWSITLNPKRYQAPSYGAVTVTLMQESTGKTWVFSGRTPNMPDAALDFYNVDNYSYGVPNCIIFRPAYSEMEAYSGDYTVKVTGLKDSSGAAAELLYRVRFAKADGVCAHQHEELQNIVEPTCTEAGYSGDRVCLDCEEVIGKGEKTNALGHSWDEGTVTIPATEDQVGTKLFTCTRCETTRTGPYHICPTEEYTDRVSDANWAHAGIDYCVSRGIMGSTSSQSLIFSPKYCLTRAQIATILWKLEDRPLAENVATYSDLNPEGWYIAPVSWANEVGIMVGTGADTFEPNKAVTREMLATILFRYWGNVKKMPTDSRADLTSFPDVDRIHEYAVEAMSWAVAEEIISGTSQSGTVLLIPRESATRAQAAAIFARFCQKFGV